MDKDPTQPRYPFTLFFFLQPCGWLFPLPCTKSAALEGLKIQYLHPSGWSHCIFRITFIICINCSYRGCFGIHNKSLKYRERRPSLIEPWVLRGSLMCRLGCTQEILIAKSRYNDHLQCGLKIFLVSCWYHTNLLFIMHKAFCTKDEAFSSIKRPEARLANGIKSIVVRWQVWHLPPKITN